MHICISVLSVAIVLARRACRTQGRILVSRIGGDQAGRIKFSAKCFSGVDRSLPMRPQWIGSDRWTAWYAIASLPIGIKWSDAKRPGRFDTMHWVGSDAMRSLGIRPRRTNSYTTGSLPIGIKWSDAKRPGRFDTMHWVSSDAMRSLGIRPRRTNSYTTVARKCLASRVENRSNY